MLACRLTAGEEHPHRREDDPGRLDRARAVARCDADDDRDDEPGRGDRRHDAHRPDGESPVERREPDDARQAGARGREHLAGVVEPGRLDDEQARGGDDQPGDLDPEHDRDRRQSAAEQAPEEVRDAPAGGRREGAEDADQGAVTTGVEPAFGGSTRSRTVVTASAAAGAAGAGTAEPAVPATALPVWRTTSSFCPGAGVAGCVAGPLVGCGAGAGAFPVAGRRVASGAGVVEPAGALLRVGAGAVVPYGRRNALVAVAAA